MLQASSPSKHNSMLGTPIPHPKSTKYDDDEDDFRTPAAKRVKREHADGLSFGSSHFRGKAPREDIIPDSDADSDDEVFEEVPQSRRTDLESALPPIQTDKEAIEAYEASRAAEQAEQAEPGLRERLNGQKWTRGKSSIYVDAFNLALKTVLDDEGHLFDEAEHAVFKHWHELYYESQYLYVRLFLRKTSSWHRINRLRYHSDIADLHEAVADLQAARELPGPSSQVEKHPGEFEVPEGTAFGQRFSFADRSEDCIKDLEEASSLLLLDELKAIAKDVKAQGKNKKELLKAFRKTSGEQRSLPFSSLKRSDTNGSTTSDASIVTGDESREATPGRSGNRDAHFVDKIMAETGPCIRLSLPALRLFERVHLVFYRSTEWTEKSLTTIILARIARRNFPQYIVSRSANIFASRSLLLEFEASVRTQFRVDNVLEFNGTPTKDTLQTVLDIFEEVYERWTILVAEEQKKEDSIYSTGEGSYLRRLSPAWVYTRIVHKGAYVLGKFKDHMREYGVINELLEQRLFHTSRRGDWYQRKALLEEHYMHQHLPSPPECKDTESRKKHWKRVALQTCEQGLQDQLTHLIFHHDLQKRTIKLEKSLKIPKRQQHEFGHVRLTKPEERTFYGVRIERPPKSNGTRRSSDMSIKPSNRGAKTVWLDPALHTVSDPETGEERKVEGECSVEEMCLSSYRALGWKGYHSEGGILRTLFGYLFYDVLFLYIPNVFQTEFQTCPLDLHTDAFYPSRMSEINTRLNEISNGDAPRLVQAVWDEHSERQTCVVGLNWTFAFEDMLEIAYSFPPAALSSAMKVMAQEYGQRGGGVPDLFLWKPKAAQGTNEDVAGDVMFSEVKSENDRLSDTQRMWIDVLAGAGVKVELCHALASEVRVQS